MIPRNKLSHLTKRTSFDGFFPLGIISKNELLNKTKQSNTPGISNIWLIRHFDYYIVEFAEEHWHDSDVWLNCITITAYDMIVPNTWNRDILVYVYYLVVYVSFFFMETSPISICYMYKLRLNLNLMRGGARVAQWVRTLDLTTHTSLSPIRREFVLGFVNYSTRSRKW